MKLTNAELKDRDRLVDELRTAKSNLEENVSKFNEVLTGMLDGLNGYVTEYNQVLEQLREFHDNVVSRLEEQFDSKSESWQESDRGQAASELKDEWENLELEDIEMFDVEMLELQEADHDENIESVSIEASV